MAKISLDELTLQVNAEIKQFEFNGQTIEVKQYLPVNDKLALISWVINQSVDEFKFYNVGKLDIFKAIGFVKYYTNIDITEDELVNAADLYDRLSSSGLLQLVLETIPGETEQLWINSTLKDTVESIYKYQNSVMGILDTVTTDYQNLNFDVEALQKNLSNPENLTLLKDVVTKLG